MGEFRRLNSVSQSMPARQSTAVLAKAMVVSRFDESGEEEAVAEWTAFTTGEARRQVAG